ncbi:hypothetical protein B0T19DRAFT_145476 [Cercophora scortea]|uniref:Uncharacterized protein n=1 Tax=Cercophora scortea TaxID=314031 RepID=A0AAE0IZE0_9PEZI|nr:hypothetical protein B0T19DRAFT_145476 [Cercophora scortea]
MPCWSVGKGSFQIVSSLGRLLALQWVQQRPRRKRRGRRDEMKIKTKMKPQRNAANLIGPSCRSTWAAHELISMLGLGSAIKVLVPHAGQPFSQPVAHLQNPKSLACVECARCRSSLSRVSTLRRGGQPRQQQHAALGLARCAFFSLCPAPCIPKPGSPVFDSKTALIVQHDKERGVQLPIAFLLFLLLEETNRCLLCQLFFFFFLCVSCLKVSLLI